MYAIIKTGGKQYRVSEGDILDVEKLDGEIGSKVEFETLMTVDGEKVDTKPTKKAAAEIVTHAKGKKIVVYKYKAKKNVRKKAGHRQSYTRVKITSLV